MTTSTDSDIDDIASIYLEAAERTKKQGYNPDGEGEEAFKFVSARIKYQIFSSLLLTT